MIHVLCVLRPLQIVQILLYPDFLFSNVEIECMRTCLSPILHRRMDTVRFDYLSHSSRTHPLCPLCKRDIRDMSTDCLTKESDRVYITISVSSSHDRRVSASHTISFNWWLVWWITDPPNKHRNNHKSVRVIIFISDTKKVEWGGRYRQSEHRQHNNIFLWSLLGPINQHKREE